MWKLLIAISGYSKVSAPPVPNTPIPNLINTNVIW